ncbi:MAG: Transcriptional regulatory protein SrrA [Firmicutes bacterium ADurb.Bin099]|jgi:DNA-binding response OmpR family regulator|nr:MAG: Transcriptional regulatory protein SrrA [Firmicutes bacterium ADurb.Bin099]HPY99150.1 response regulator transcription factor [Clostridia bacterium]
MNIHVLICDDDPLVHEALSVYFDKFGMTHQSAFNGQECLDLYQKGTFDVIVLDIMMPVIDGMEVCRRIRISSTIPIILLTAKSEEVDRLLGFDLGADDYITKPFSSLEVIARIKAIINRVRNPSQKESSGKVSFKQLTVDITRYSILINDVPTHATPKEVEVLFLLLSNPRIVFTREQIMNLIWGYEYTGDTRTIDTHIKRIRAKLPAEIQKCIQTIYGVGYKFECNEE